jgi:MFS family permease
MSPPSSALLGTLAPSFELLVASRIAAGIFGGGLVPLVLAALGDAFDMQRRQVVNGPMLVAMIVGQMLGSVVAGLARAPSAGAPTWPSPRCSPQRRACSP